MDEMSQKYQNPNKIFTVFFKKTNNFLLDLRNNQVRLGKNWNERAGPS